MASLTNGELAEALTLCVGLANRAEEANARPLRQQVCLFGNKW